MQALLDACMSPAGANLQTMAVLLLPLLAHLGEQLIQGRLRGLPIQITHIQG